VVEPEEGHVRRDVPINISASLKPGMNTIKILVDDENASSYAMALVRTFPRTVEDISRSIPMCESQEARDRVVTLLSPNWEAPAEKPAKSDADPDAGGDSDAEITCVISNKLRLRCPLSFERVQIPVRGEQCVHLQCFGLGAYLEANSKMRAMNNRWTCPVCNVVLRPQDLRIDEYVKMVLTDTADNIEEVAILQDGSYRVIEEEDEDMKQPAASPGGADAQEADTAEQEEEAADKPTVEGVTFSVEDEAKKKRKDLVQFETPAEKRQKRRQQRAQHAAAAALAAGGANGGDNDAGE